MKITQMPELSERAFYVLKRHKIIEFFDITNLSVHDVAAWSDCESDTLNEIISIMLAYGLSFSE